MLDAWEDLLIYQFKPSLNSMGVEQKTDSKGIYTSCGIPKVSPIQPISSIPIAMISLLREAYHGQFFRQTPGQALHW